MNELRRNLELLVNTIRNSLELKTNDENSIRIELMEVFDPLIGLLRFSIGYLQRPYDGKSSSCTLTNLARPDKKLSTWKAAYQREDTLSVRVTIFRAKLCLSSLLTSLHRQGLFAKLEQRHGAQNQRIFEIVDSDH